MAGLAAGDGGKLERARVYLLLLLATAVLIGGSVGAFYYLSLPMLGLSFGRGDIVAGVDTGSPAELAGLAIGDRVITINGVSPLAGEIYVRSRQEIVPLIVQRNGQIFEVEIRPVQLPPMAVLGRIGYYLTALAFWIMAMVVLVFKTHDRTPQMLVVTLLLAALGFVVLLLADLGLGWASVLMSTIILMLGPLYVHYHTVFPWQTGLPGRKTALIVLYGVSALLWLAVLLSRAHRLEWSTLVLSTVKGYFGLCLILGWSLLLRAYRHATSIVLRRQIGVVALGMFTALVPLTVLILLPQILPQLHYVTIWPAFLVLALIPASYLYAIFRHNLMQFDWIVNQNVARFFLFLSILALYLALFWLAQKLTPLAPNALQGPAAAGIVTNAFLILILMGSYQPLKKWIEKTVHELLYGSWYDYKSFISRMTQAFSQALDEATVASLIVKEVAGTTRLKAIALLLANQNQPTTFKVGAQAGFELPEYLNLDQEVIGFLRQAQDLQEHRVLRESIQPETPAGRDLAAWGGAGVQAWVPLLQQGELVGLLVVGGKTAGESLTGEDRDILNTLAHHVTSAVARVHLVEQREKRMQDIQALSRKLLSTQDEIRQRIASEIHSQAVPEVIGVLRTLDGIKPGSVQATVEKARHELSEHLNNLRLLMGELRPSVLGFSDLREMLQQHAESFERKRNLPVTLHVSENGGDVPATAREAVFRVFEEALNNAWQHAGAQKVDSVLDLDTSHVRLVICDDGVGFEVPAGRDHVRKAGHLGLIEMQERIAAVGGTWHLESQPGHGTRVVVQVPLLPVQTMEGAG